MSSGIIAPTKQATLANRVNQESGELQEFDEDRSDPFRFISFRNPPHTRLFDQLAERPFNFRQSGSLLRADGDTGSLLGGDMSLDGGLGLTETLDALLLHAAWGGEGVLVDAGQEGRG